MRTQHTVEQHVMAETGKLRAMLLSGTAALSYPLAFINKASSFFPQGNWSDWPFLSQWICSRIPEHRLHPPGRRIKSTSRARISSSSQTHEIVMGYLVVFQSHPLLLSPFLPSSLSFCVIISSDLYILFNIYLSITTPSCVSQNGKPQPIPCW